MTQHTIFILREEDRHEWREVIEDICWLYQDMATSYGGFGHNLDYEPIDYKKYFFTVPEEDPYDRLALVAETLRKGSLAALCCNVVNLFDEEQRDEEVIAFINQALAHPMIEEMPVEKEVLHFITLVYDEPVNPGWEEDPHGRVLHEMLKDVYRQTALRYYYRMLEVGLNFD